MKRQCFSLITLSFMLICLLFSCGDISSITYIGNNSNLSILNGSVSNYSTIDSSANQTDSKQSDSQSRTIMSNADLNVYTYYLYGYTSTGRKYPITKITNVDSSGNFTVALDPAYWNLTLFAIKKVYNASTNTYEDASVGLNESGISETAHLIGYSVADLTNSSGTAVFTLSTNGLTGSGNMRFPVVLSNDNGATNWTLSTIIEDVADRRTIYATAELRDLITGETINYTNGYTTKQTIINNASVSSAVFGEPDYGMAPGTYNFVVTFIDTSGKVRTEWSDVIIITTARKVESTVYVPNMFGTVPEKPASFTATYVKNSEDSKGHEGLYKVHFQWENTPNNELYYEIQVADIATRRGATLTDYIWDYVGPANQFVYGKDFHSYSERVDGALWANNTDATVWLKLGHIYQARIRSVGFTGNSGWTYLTLPDGTTENTGNAATDKVTGYTETLAYFGSEAINRGRIIYNLNNGSYKESASTSTKRHKVEYFTQKTPVTNTDGGVAYWNGTGYDDSSEDDDLVRNGNQLKYWCNSLSLSESSRVFEKDGTNKYTGYDNLVLYADYGRDADPVATEEYTFVANWISYQLNNGATGRITDDTTSKVAVMTVSKSNAASIVFTLRPPSSMLNGYYSRVAMEVYSADNNTMPIQSTSYPPSGSSSYVSNPQQIATVSLSDTGIYTIKFTVEKTIGASVLQDVTLLLVVEE